MCSSDLQRTDALEEKIGQWREYLRRRQAIHPVDVAELEDHLREQVAALPGENQTLKVLSYGSPLFILKNELRFGRLRRGIRQPWLDDYAATNPAEFFAVTCEAYFVQRERFAQELPTLLPLYDGFFRP